MIAYTIFVLALALSAIASPVARNNDGGECPPKQLCSKCPRKDNGGHDLQTEIGDAHYIHCQYQDTDCFYGPKSDGDQLAFGYPANACPNLLTESICSDVVPQVSKFLDTVCPDFNLNFVHAPLRSQPENPTYTQCHYSTSECYYDSAGNLVPSISIPVPSPPTVPEGVCPPRIVASHLQYGI